MSFKQGDRIHTHDGRIVTVRRKGTLPKLRRGPREHSAIRGFVRAALVDPDGTEHESDYYENTVTEYGHQMIVRNYIGLVSSDATVAATGTAQLGWARYWGLGYMTLATTDASRLSTMTAIDSTEYGLASTGGVSRATVSAGTQRLSGTWSLSQSFQYQSSYISHAQTVNCVAQYHNSSVGAGTAHSLATFASSTKGTTQALNVTYNWLFST